MRKLSPERRRLVVAAGASAAVSSSSVLLFRGMPHTVFNDSLHGLVVGVPLGITLMLLYRWKRSSGCSKEPDGN